MGQMTLPGAHVVSCLIETLLYGIFIMLCVISLYFFAERARRQNPGVGLGFLKQPLVLANMGIFMVITGHWIINATRLYQAFVGFNHGQSTLRYYTNLMHPTYVVGSGFLEASLIICDAMMTYRLWIVWNRSRAIIIFPCITLLGMTALAIRVVYGFSRLKSGEMAYSPSVYKWVVITASFTIATNVYCTLFIAWKIYKVSSPTAPVGASSLRHVTAVIVESAALYALWVVLFLVTYTTQITEGIIITDLLPMIAGLSFMLINVRAGLGSSRRTASASKMPSRLVFRNGRMSMRNSTIDLETMHMERTRKARERTGQTDHIAVDMVEATETEDSMKHEDSLAKDGANSTRTML